MEKGKEEDIKNDPTNVPENDPMENILHLEAVIDYVREQIPDFGDPNRPKDSIDRYYGSLLQRELFIKFFYNFEKITFLTWNILASVNFRQNFGMFPSYNPYPKEEVRTDFFIKTLIEQDASIVCLQEVSGKEQYEKIKKGTGYKNGVYSSHRTKKMDACCIMTNHDIIGYKTNYTEKDYYGNNPFVICELSFQRTRSGKTSVPQTKEWEEMLNRCIVVSTHFPTAQVDKLDRERHMKYI